MLRLLQILHVQNHRRHQPHRVFRRHRLLPRRRWPAGILQPQKNLPYPLRPARLFLPQRPVHRQRPRHQARILHVQKIPLPRARPQFLRHRGRVLPL